MKLVFHNFCSPKVPSFSTLSKWIMYSKNEEVHTNTSFNNAQESQIPSALYVHTWYIELHRNIQGLHTKSWVTGMPSSISTFSHFLLYMDIMHLKQIITFLDMSPHPFMYILLPYTLYILLLFDSTIDIPNTLANIEHFKIHLYVLWLCSTCSKFWS